MNNLLNALSMLEKPDGIIAFPTDTVYGLGCLPNKPNAIRKIYKIKGRNQAKPLILLGKNKNSFGPFLKTLPPRALALMDAHWPGGLTLVLPKTQQVSEEMTQGFDTVGIRVPDCSLLLDFLELTPQGVLATTSANKSGQKECLTSQAVRETFGDEIDYLLEGDHYIQEAVPSTVAAVNEDGHVQILRQGAVQI